jgi:hypothetical protein
VFIRTQTNGSRTYLLLVENQRINGRPVQRVLHRLGRLDELRASGQIDTLIQSLGRFADKLVVLDAHAKGDTIPTATTTIGPGLIFDSAVAGVRHSGRSAARVGEPAVRGRHRTRRLLDGRASPRGAGQ